MIKPWLEPLLDAGLVPYVATSEALLDSLDLSEFGGHTLVRRLEDPAHRNFHEAYLVSNSLGFGEPDLKMPNWVYIDCVLMQTAVVGFAISIKKAPDSLVSLYERDPYVNVEDLDYIPISGQIAGMGLDGNSLIGFSLFSLRRQLSNVALPPLGPLTKYAALKAYRADQRDRFVGISQYENRALRSHARFSKKMYIDQPIVMLHPWRDMSFMYSMKVEFDEDRIFNGISDGSDSPAEIEMRVDDREMKDVIQAGLAKGDRYYIKDPIHIEKDDGLYVAIGLERGGEQ